MINAKILVKIFSSANKNYYLQIVVRLAVCLSVNLTTPKLEDLLPSYYFCWIDKSPGMITLKLKFHIFAGMR